MKRTLTFFAAAALLAGTARAQSPNIPWVKGKDREATGASTPTRPAPAPRTQAPPATAPGAQGADGTPQAGGRPLDDRQRRILGTLHLRNAMQIELAALARTKAATEDVRRLGEQLEADHRRFDQEVVDLARERGGDINAISVPEWEREQHRTFASQLGSAQGPAFDREFVKVMERLHVQYDEELKKMVNDTNGEDARLKSWVDRMEYAEQMHRDAVRRVRDAVDEGRATARAGQPPAGTASQPSSGAQPPAQGRTPNIPWVKKR